MYRRRFLETMGVAALGLPFATPTSSDDAGARRSVVKALRVRPGDTVALVAPAGAVYVRDDVEVMKERVEALGLRPKVGAHVFDRRGYLAGSEEARTADLMAAFTDPEVDAILAMRGGWGCARLLPLVDYEAVRAHPKVLCGYSDVTALHLALYARSGLATFHGPTGVSTWNPFTVDHFRRVVFDGELVTMRNPTERGNRLVQVDDRVRTITPGIARGRLVGGNLTVLTALMGTPYLPDFSDHILFLEDVGEDIYRIDRMLTQLRLAGVLEQLAGFVFGKCTRCGPGGGYASLTLEEVLDDHVRSLGIPAYAGAMIGHVTDKFTVPVGVEAEIDAERGTIRLLEAAVE